MTPQAAPGIPLEDLEGQNGERQRDHKLSMLHEGIRGQLLEQGLKWFADKAFVITFRGAALLVPPLVTLGCGQRIGRASKVTRSRMSLAAGLNFRFFEE